MSDAPPDPPAATGPIGLSAYTRLAHQRIDDYLKQKQSEALVIGVFGEWGSGKSTLLDSIARKYTNIPPAAGAETEVVLRIEFNAWRYEREDHLLVPLLFTVETALNEYVAAIDKQTPPPVVTPKRWWQWTRESAAANASWLGQRAVLLGACLAALTRAIKPTVSLPGLEIEIDTAAALEALQAQRARQEPRAARAAEQPSRQLQSLYYDLHRELRKVTRGQVEGSPKLNFVFFIDDLDRCLPEKAVEMLEAIKLFLDIEGCVFVLAVDDEVVERGIAHRYRDYLGLGNRWGDSVAYSLKPQRFREYRSQFAIGGQSGSAPITGHEYLEKIIQLPIRLPRFSRPQARQLIFDTASRLGCADLFAASAAYPGREVNEWLLDLFLTAAPLSPRKLIRAVELLDFVHRLAVEQGRWESLHPYTLAQLVLLQCFAPHMFRDLARRRAAAWKRLGERITQADGARVAIGSPSFLTWWEQQIDSDKVTKADPGTVKRAEVIEEPFLAQLRETIGLRSGFDPRDLFLVGYDVDDDLAPYFNVLVPLQPIADAAATATPAPQAPTQVTTPVASGETPSPAGAVATPAAAPSVVAPRPEVGPRVAPPPAPPPEPSRPRPAESAPSTASPRQPTTFVDLLFAPDAATRIGAVRDEPSLEGRVLDSRTVGMIADRMSAAPNTLTASWLSTIGANLSDADLDRVMRASNAGDLASAKAFADIDRLGRLLEWYCMRKRPWHIDKREPLELPFAAIDLDPHRFEWSYRYLRGLRQDAVSPKEALEIWPAYASTTRSAVKAIVELAPGRVVMATVEGEVGIWSRAIRGQWQKNERVTSAGAGDLQIASVGTFTVALHVKGQGLSLWKRDTDSWFQMYWDSASPEASLLTSLGAGIVAFAVPTQTLRVYVGDSTAAGTAWHMFEWMAAHTISAIVPLPDRHVLILGDRGTVLKITSDGLAFVLDIGTEAPFTHAIRVGERYLIVTRDGTVRLWSWDGAKLTSDSDSTLGTALAGITAVRVNGRLAMLLASDGSCEIWDFGKDGEPTLLGAGTIGPTPGAGVSLLRDGSVMVASPTGTQVFALNHVSRRLEFAEFASSVEPAPTVLVRTLGEEIFVAKDAVTYALGPTAPGADALAWRMSAPLRGAAAGSGSLALIGQGRTVAFVTHKTPAAQFVPIEDEPRCMATRGERVLVGTRRQLLTFAQSPDGRWEMESSVDLARPIDKVVTDGQDVALGWADFGDVVTLSRLTGSSRPGETREWTLPEARISSVVAVPRTWRAAPEDEEPRFLVCSAQVITILKVGHLGVRHHQALAVPRLLPDEFRFALPLENGSLMTLSRQGVVSVSAPGDRTSVSYPLLRGAPRHALVSGDVVVVLTDDDGVYRLAVTAQGDLEVRRYLVQPPILLLEEMEQYGAVTSAIICPLTTNYAAFQAGPNQLDPAIVRMSGWLRGNGELADVFERPQDYQYGVTAGVPVLRVQRRTAAGAIANDVVPA